MPPSRPARAFSVALLAAVLGALLPATAAQAAERTVQGGRLDWGIKSSFRTYVTGPVAQGGFRLVSGAATVGSGFRFHSAKGAYDPATGSFEARFTGGVHFTGHRKPDGSHEMDLRLSRPTVKVSGGRGTLHADIVSKARGTGKVTTGTQIPFASLNLSGIDMRGGRGPIALTGIPATLTAQGAANFAGFYPAGTPLDPVSLSVDLTAERQNTPPSATAAPSAKPSASAATGGNGEKNADKNADKSPGAGAFRDAAVDWGVRRTFREYVTGPIADGGWKVTGGARDGGALFRFPQGRGTYDPAKRTLSATFGGAVRFTGNHLDLTLAGVRAEVRAGRGTLSADVTSQGTTTRQVPLITFAAADFTPKNGLVSLTEVPAVLTEGGSKAFGGMYRAGTTMDPVSLAVAVDAGAALPALPDLGSGADTAPEAPTSPAAPATTSAAATTAGSSGDSFSTGAYLAAGAGALAAAAVALWAVRRRAAARNH
jgi:hypothetical protein